jgi:glycosyltransferase involved in cell wall biosynthesis
LALDVIFLLPCAPMNTREVTPLILTWNEEPNLRRCLDGLRWAVRVVVVDSGSTDATPAICAEYPNVELVVRPFDNHTDQWNFGLYQVTTPWVLSLDADYGVSEAFVSEMKALEPEAGEVAWYAHFCFRVYGRPLRGSLYPPRAVLFDRKKCRYVADGHTQMLDLAGSCGTMKTFLDHDDRKPLSRWFDSQLKYARLEAEKLESEPHLAGFPDRLRRMIWPAAPATFIYTLVIKGVILDGWPGWFYVLQRTYAELILSLILLERRLATRTSH